MKKKNFINYCGLLGVAAFISYGFVEIKPLKVGGRISIEANCCMELKSPDQLFNWLSDIVDNDGRFLEEGNQVR